MTILQTKCVTRSAAENLRVASVSAKLGVMDKK